MNTDAQQIIALGLVAVAGVDAARRLWNLYRKRGESGCPGCGQCGKPARPLPQPIPLVTLTVRRRPVAGE